MNQISNSNSNCNTVEVYLEMTKPIKNSNDDNIKNDINVNNEDEDDDAHRKCLNWSNMAQETSCFKES